MTEQNTSRASTSTTKKVVRTTIVAVIVSAGVSGWLAYDHYTDPEYVRARAEAYLQEFVNGRVTVGSARFSWLDGIELSDVAVANASLHSSDKPDPMPPDSAENVFFCPKITLTHDLVSSVIGGRKIESIVAFAPTCMVVRSAASGTTNLAGLWRPLPTSSSEAAFALPTIELRDACVRVVYSDADHDRIVDEITLDVRSRHSNRDARYYDVVWSGGGSQTSSGHSQIDVQTGRVRNVDGGLPWMSVEAVLIAVNAGYDEAGTWSDLLGLEGAVRATDYNFEGNVDSPGPRSATLELDNASLSIPITDDEQPLAVHERYLRFEQADGTIEVTSEGIRAEFAALFHGAKCQASAEMHGGMRKLTTLDDVDLDVEVSIQGFELPEYGTDAPPEHLRFINRWQRLAKFFRDFDPHGAMDLELTARKKAGGDKPIALNRLLITATGTDASFRKFPYRLNNLNGTVELTPDRVAISSLRGEHSGGFVTIDGWLAEPRPGNAVELKISATNIPIDQSLYEASPSKYQRFHDMFELDGRINLELSLSRPPSVDEERSNWSGRCSFSFDDLSARYAHFPYPLNGLSGLLLVDAESLEVIDVSGTSGDARVGLNGTVGFGAERKGSLNLDVWGKDVEFDDNLMAALPEAVRKQLETFHPTGRFDLRARLSSEARAQPLRHELDVSLSDVSILHDSFPLSIGEIEGILHITPEAIVVDRVAGTYHGATLSARGRVDLTAAPPQTQLEIHCRDLALDEPLRAASPKSVRKALEDWHIDQPIDVDVTLQTATSSGEHSLTVGMTAHLDDATVRHDAFPIPFEKVRGTITIDDTGTRAPDLKALYGAASIQASFETRDTDAGTAGNMALQATGLVLDESLRNLLPEALRNTWDRLAPQGHVDAHIDQLSYQPLSDSEQSVWFLDGRLELDDVALPTVAGAKHISGTMTAKGSLVDRLGGARLSGVMGLTDVEILGQRISVAEASWSYARIADGRTRFSLDRIRGNIYGGSLSGSVEITSDGTNASYDITTTLHEMDIAPFLNSTHSTDDGARKPVNVRGVADARFYLTGRLGVPTSRRGGGRIEIHDGHIYKLPIMLSILNVIRLAVPDEDAFDDVEAQFHITANRVEFSRIILNGSVLALTGYGSMSLPDCSVDLYLVNTSPRGWLRVPGVGDFVESASRELLELRVTGPLSHPTARLRPLGAITEEFKKLFQQKDSKKTMSASP